MTESGHVNKWYKTSGWITRDVGGGSIFVHRNYVIGKHRLCEGTRVEFRTEVGRDGNLCAADVNITPAASEKGDDRDGESDALSVISSAPTQLRPMAPDFYFQILVQSDRLGSMEKTLKDQSERLSNFAHASDLDSIGERVGREEETLQQVVARLDSLDQKMCDLTRKMDGIHEVHEKLKTMEMKFDMMKLIVGV